MPKVSSSSKRRSCTCCLRRVWLTAAAPSLARWCGTSCTQGPRTRRLSSGDPLGTLLARQLQCWQAPCWIQHLPTTPRRSFHRPSWLRLARPSTSKRAPRRLLWVLSCIPWGNAFRASSLGRRSAACRVQLAGSATSSIRPAGSTGDDLARHRAWSTEGSLQKSWFPRRQAPMPRPPKPRLQRFRKCRPRKSRLHRLARCRAHGCHQQVDEAKRLMAWW